MKTRSPRHVLTACILTIVSLALTGCPKDDEKPAATGAGTPATAAPAAPSAPAAGGKSWEGKYYNADEKMIIELKPNHVATLTEEGDPNVASITWETVGPEKITVHMIGDFKIDMLRNPDGTLRDTEGKVWVKK